jgi:hypothetical protein
MTDAAHVREIAAEGWIYGYPLLENYRTMYAQAVDASDARYTGGFGRFRHYSEPFTPANTDVVTPNNDTPYSWGWLDLRAEPWLVSVPAVDRYYVLPFHDIDTPYAGFIGARTTGQDAGTYLVAGPDWNGPEPEGLSGTIRADSFIVGILGRTYLAGPDDVPRLREIQQQYDLQPLHRHAGTPAPPSPPKPRWPAWKEKALATAEFFAYLDFLLGFFPVRETEAERRARLASIGVDGNGTFDPAALSEELRAAIEAGIADGQAQLNQAAATARDSTGWFGTRAQHGNDYLTRAVGVNKGLYGLPSQEAWYAGWIFDSAGEHPDATKHYYTVHFAAGELPPARFFWSATMYRLPERLLVDNPIDRYSIGDRTPGVVYDADGGLTLYVQHEQPTEPDQAANWLPAPDGRFTIAIRLYGPDESVLTGGWKLPELTVAEPKR